MEETIIFKEHTEYLFGKLVSSPGKLILTNQRLKWQKDYEFFGLTMIRRLAYSDFNKDNPVDINLNQIKKVCKDEFKPHDLLVYTNDGKELRFISEKRKLDSLIESINTAILNYKS